MIQDLIASYKLKTKLSLPEIEDMLEMVKGVRSSASHELAGGEVTLEIHMHGQTSPDVAEATAQRVLTMFRSNRNVSEAEYHGIPGEIEPAPDVAWTGGDKFDDITLNHNGQLWVRSDYFIHALSYLDVGIRDENTEMLLVQAFQTWPQRAQAREAIRRVRGMYTLMRDVRRHGGGTEAEQEETPVPPPDAPLAPLGYRPIEESSSQQDEAGRTETEPESPEQPDKSDRRKPVGAST